MRYVKKTEIKIFGIGVHGPTVNEQLTTISARVQQKVKILKLGTISGI